MIREFRDFINKGNFVDLAVAFVIGAAFATVATTFNDRIVSPLIGLIGSVDSLGDVGTFANGEGSVGAFLEAVINFLIVGFAMFLVVKAYNRFREADEPAGPSEDVLLLREIRNELRATRGGPRG